MTILRGSVNGSALSEEYIRSIASSRHSSGKCNSGDNLGEVPAIDLVDDQHEQMIRMLTGTVEVSVDDGVRHERQCGLFVQRAKLFGSFLGVAGHEFVDASKFFFEPGEPVSLRLRTMPPPTTASSMSSSKLVYRELPQIPDITPECRITADKWDPTLRGVLFTECRQRCRASLTFSLLRFFVAVARVLHSPVLSIHHIHNSTLNVAHLPSA